MLPHQQEGLRQRGLFAFVGIVFNNLHSGGNLLKLMPTYPHL